MPGVNHRAVGTLGEDAVCAYLQAQGAEILSRNFTIRGAELDIVARQGEWLLFVEVKTRRAGAFASGAEAVDKRKQQRLITAATAFLQRYPQDLQPRFDVAEVVYTGKTVTEITYLPFAFDASSASGTG